MKETIPVVLHQSVCGSLLTGGFLSLRNGCVTSSVPLTRALISLEKITLGLSCFRSLDGLFSLYRKPALQTGGEEFKRYWHLPGWENKHML